jgi:hypothetical protein
MIMETGNRLKVKKFEEPHSLEVDTGDEQHFSHNLQSPQSNPQNL